MYKILSFYSCKISYFKVYGLVGVNLVNENLAIAYVEVPNDTIA